MLPRYGLDGSPKGVMQMMGLFNDLAFQANEEFQQLGVYLNALLFTEPSEDDAVVAAALTPAAEAEAEAPTEVP